MQLEKKVALIDMAMYLGIGRSQAVEDKVDMVVVSQRGLRLERVQLPLAKGNMRCEIAPRSDDPDGRGRDHKKLIEFRRGNDRQDSIQCQRTVFAVVFEKASEYRYVFVTASASGTSTRSDWSM